MTTTATDLERYDAIPAVHLSPQDLEMIRRQVDVPQGKRPPSDAELTDFGRMCMARRLDPFDRHIYLANFGKGWRGFVGVHGRLVIAFRSGLVEGMEGPFFCGPRVGELARSQPPDWQELWDGEGRPHAAKFVVHRRGMERASPVGIARWAEYGKDRPPWTDKPTVMLGYKAITRALNLVFPDIMPADPERDPDVDIDESVGYVRDERDAEPAYVIHRDERPRAMSAAQVAEIQHLLRELGLEGVERQQVIDGAVGFHVTNTAELNADNADDLLTVLRHERTRRETGDVTPEEF